MSAVARRHHYRSQFYLGGFTPSGSKDDQLTVIGLDDARVFVTSAVNLAVKRDFNRIDNEGVDPDVLERMLSETEGLMADALVQLHEGKPFEGAVKNALINMVAFFAVRSPQWREFWAKLKATFAKQKLREALASPEAWAAHVQQVRKHGIHLSVDDYEALKRYDAEHDIEVIPTREANIRTELMVVEELVPWLWERSWLICEATEETGPFITGDHPVSLNWSGRTEVPLLFQDSPGFGQRETRITFPLSKRLALIGEFDGREGWATAPIPLVAAVNGFTFRNAHHQLYAPSLAFSVQIENEVHDGAHLVHWIEQRRNAGRTPDSVG
jgi:hypothetical protein